MNNAMAHALEYNAAGMNVIPLNRYDAMSDDGKPLGKTPLHGENWRQWQRKRQTEADIERLFSNHDGNIGVIGGREIEGSGFLHWAEFDDMGHCREVVTALAQSGVETWITETKRGQHIWATAAKPIKTHAYQWGEMRGAGSYVLGPPSIHPTGKPYVFRAKPDRIANIEAWPGLPALEFLDPFSSTYPRLVGRILNNDPATLARYHSRSETDYALIVSLVNAGYTPQVITVILATATYPSHYRELEPDRRATWLMAAYLKAKSQSHKAAFTEVRNTAEHLKTWALTAPARAITGNIQTAATDRAALMAHATTAAKIGKFEYQLSERDGADIAKSTRRTFRNATRRLTAAGYIEPAEKAVFGLASRWRLNPKVDKVAPLTYIQRNVCEWGNLVQPDTHGIFSARSSQAAKGTLVAEKLTLRTLGTPRPPQGLGRAVGDTWQLLIGAAMTTDELVEASGRCKRTIKRHIQRLSGQGLIVLDGYTYSAVTTPDVIERVAMELATTHVDGNRAKKHRAERKFYRAALVTGKAGNRAISRKK